MKIHGVSETRSRDTAGEPGIKGIRKDSRDRLLNLLTPVTLAIEHKVKGSFASWAKSGHGVLGFPRLMKISWRKTGYLRGGMSKGPSSKTGEVSTTLGLLLETATTQKSCT